MWQAARQLWHTVQWAHGKTAGDPSGEWAHESESHNDHWFCPPPHVLSAEVATHHTNISMRKFKITHHVPKRLSRHKHFDKEVLAYWGRGWTRVHWEACRNNHSSKVIVNWRADFSCWNSQNLPTQLSQICSLWILGYVTESWRNDKLKIISATKDTSTQEYRIAETLVAPLSN